MKQLNFKKPHLIMAGDKVLSYNSQSLLHDLSSMLISQQKVEKYLIILCNTKKILTDKLS